MATDIAALIAALPADDDRPYVAARLLPDAWRELLVDLKAGRVADDEDCTPLLDIGTEHVPVEKLVWAMYGCGLAHQPGDGRRWALTELGEAVLAETHMGGAG
jgi:hypothetical protein